MAGQPKTPFFVAVGVVVLGLVAFGAYMGRDILFPKGNVPAEDGGEPIDPSDLTMNQVENPTSAGITTLDKWTFKPSERLLPISADAASDYKPMENDTVRFALNVWAGWAPVIYANEGHRPKKVWKTPDGKEFKVEFVLIDNPISMQETFVAGDIHIGWATLDMLPLFMERMVDNTGKPIDSRVMPRVYQQVDWSAGGDGIVVRENIKQVSDLRKKTIVLAENSPSHYFVLNMLVNGGVQPSEVNFRFTNDAFEAAAAFNSSPEIAACVSWAPDIYNLADVQGNRMLVDTSTANRLIADVWFARADFARDNPGIIEGLVRGIFDAMDEMKSQQAKKTCAAYMSAFYNIPETETIQMFADAYSTGWGDNYQFFMNKNYGANFERVWNNAYFLYRRVGSVKNPRVDFDKVMDFTYIDKLSTEDKYKAQIQEQHIFGARDVTPSEVESSFLTATHYIHFFPNSADLHKKIIRKEGGNEIEELYDPSVDITLEKIYEQIAQFERSRIAIEGHADSSMKGQVDANMVVKLSKDRAEAVKQALLKKYENLDANRFTSIGRGWDKPANPGEPDNHAKNRRVEVRVLPAESQ